MPGRFRSIHRGLLHGRVADAFAGCSALRVSFVNFNTKGHVGRGGAECKPSATAKTSAER